MSLELYCDDELLHVLRWDFKGRWTWREYHRYTEKVSVTIHEMNVERVDIIVDLTESEAYPPGIIQQVIRGTPAQPEVTDPAWGITVLVGGGLLVQIFFNLLYRTSTIFQTHYRRADSLTAARQIIQCERDEPTNPI